MRKQILLILTMALTTVITFAAPYKVTIQGIMIDAVGHPIGNKKVWISTPANQTKFKYSDSSITAASTGAVKFEIMVPDSIPSGYLIISFGKCTGRITSGEIAFSKSNTITSVRLIYCDQDITACKSTITLKKLNDTIGLAIVQKKGVAPYTTTWSTEAKGDTIRYNLNISNKYCVKTIDATGCISEACFEHRKTCANSVVAFTLNDSTAWAYVIAKGTGKLNHLWTTGSTKDTIRYDPRNKLKICVKTTDAVGCVSESCVTNTIPSCVVVIDRKDNILTAIVKELSASDEVQYNWSNGKNTKSIEVKEAGEYCVKINTKNGCSTSACYTIKPNQDTCKGKVEIVRDGNKLVASMKNDIAIKYYWSNNSDGPITEIKQAGTYCVKVEGNSGCFYKECIDIKDGTACEATIELDSLGSINQDAIPGVKLKLKANFKLDYIEWNTGEKTPTIIVKKSGEYCATISDNVRCKMIICKKVVLENAPCKLEIVQKLDSAKKQAVLSFAFSSTPKLFVWSTNEVKERIVVTKSGEYCVTVSDNVGCKQQACTKVVLNDDNPGTGSNACSALISVTPTSNKEMILRAKLTGKSPIHFEWSTGSAESAIIVTKGGMYCVTMKDGAGCTSKTCVEVVFPSANPGLVAEDKKLNAEQNKMEAGHKLHTYPNPAFNTIQYDFIALQDAKGTIKIVNLMGRKVYEEDIDISKGKMTGNLDISYLPEGVYQMVIDYGQIQINNKVLIAK